MGIEAASGNNFIFSITQAQGMYTGFKPNASLSKTVVPGLSETHLETLQREVDTYTRKLQQQKKKYFSIQDMYKVVSEQHEREKNRLNELKKQSTKAHNVIVQAKIKNREADLEKAVSTYDETMAHNAKLKAEIDMLRREKKNYIESQAILEQNIKQHEEEIAKKIAEINAKQQTAQSLKNGIMEIKEKNQEQREEYIQQFQSLEKDYLREKRQRQQFKFQKSQKPEPIDTQPLLKHRLKRLIKSNKSKIKMIEQYKKHMKQIQEAFNQIKTNSGIESLSEITNTFIKSEQQNYSLYNYMDSLSRSIDQLQKSNLELENNIKKQEQAQQERKNSMYCVADQEKKKKELQQYILKKQQATKQLNKLIDSIKPTLSSTLLQLSQSALNDDPNKPIEYQLGINITDRSIENYLSDLQRYINNLLILKQEAKPKVVKSMKDNVTMYSKPVPNIGNQDVVKGVEIREEQRLMDEGKFREYAMEYWEKRKNKAKE